MKNILSYFKFSRNDSEANTLYFIPHTSYSRGFTLFEMVLSVGILALFATLIVPLSQSLQNRNALESAAQTVSLALREAQARAIAGEGDNDWGVYLQDGSVTLFQGNGYGDNPSSEDEHTFSPTVTVSGEVEIVFEKLTGETDDTDDLVLTGPDGEVHTISVNAKGTIDY